jgi:hypothetical protein
MRWSGMMDGRAAAWMRSMEAAGVAHVRGAARVPSVRCGVGVPSMRCAAGVPAVRSGKGRAAANRQGQNQEPKARKEKDTFHACLLIRSVSVAERRGTRFRHGNVVLPIVFSVLAGPRGYIACQRELRLPGDWWDSV